MTKKTVIRVVKKPGQFATIHKAYLSDKRLGLDAMGLMTWLLAKPDDWKPHVGNIASSTGSAYGRVRSSMKKLEECGYVRRSPVRDRRTGRIMRWEYCVFETPQAAQDAEDEQPSLFEKVEAKPSTTGRKQGSNRTKPRFEQNTPVVENPGGGFPESGYPHDGKPLCGNRHLLITNVTKNDLTKQRTTNPPADEAEASADASAADGSDRLPAGAGGSGSIAATSEPSSPARAGGDRGDVVVDSEEQIVSSLVSLAYFPLTEATKLIGEYGAAACGKALRCLQQARKRPANVRGFVVQALKERWEPAAGKPATALPVRPTAVVPPEVAAKADQERALNEQLQREQQAMDAALSRLSPAEWETRTAVLRPRLGQHIIRLLDGGRQPSEIQSIRRLVYEDVQREAVGCVAA